MVGLRVFKKTIFIKQAVSSVYKKSVGSLETIYNFAILEVSPRIP
jgi:hypothetical protein